MSYILDALRKADAQRERDPARGIHAQPAQPGFSHEPRPDSRLPWAFGGLVALMLVAGGAWLLLRDTPVNGPRAQVAATAVPASTEAPQAAATATPLVAPTPAALTPAAPVVVAQAVMPPPVVTAPRPVQYASAPNRAERQMGRPALVPPPGAAPSPAGAAPVAPAPPAAAAASAPVAGAPGSPAAGTAGAAAPARAISAPAVAASAPLAVGLPPDAPKLAISGGVYSAAKAQRMLIVNGQVATEGADLGSGVTLEEIRPKTAVLRFRGARYSVSY